MKCSNILAIVVFLFSNFTCAEIESDNVFVKMALCDSQQVKLNWAGPGGVVITSIRTDRKTEVSCMGQCSIDEWACVFVDDIPYLLFRGVNVERYTLGQIEGREYIGHWAMQLNEISWGTHLKHQHVKALSSYLKKLDKTKDREIIYSQFGVDYNQSVYRSKYRRLVRETYPYISKIYESAKFSSVDLQ